MAINNITLGEDQPLSNDLKPIKVGGEASILEISSPLPDGSDSGLFRVDGDLDITGTLKTKLSHDLIYDFDDEVNTLAQVKIDALIDSAPAALDTLNELAAALGDDASFATTVTNSLALKAPLAAPAFTGNATFDSTTLTIDATNNRVGIGTASPDSNLHIKSSSATQPVLQLETALDGGGADTFIRFGDSTENYSYALGIDDSSNTFRLAYNGSSYNGAVLGTTDLIQISTAGLVTLEGLSLGGHPMYDIDVGSEFVDTDDHLMTSGAIKEKIESYSYLPLAGGDMTGHLQVTASDGNHSGSGAYVPTGSDWQDVLRLGSTGTNGLNFIVNDGGTMKATYWTARWGAQHEWARNSNPSSPDSNVYQPIARLTGNDTDQYFRLFAGTSNAIPVNIQAEGSTDTYFNNSSNNVAIGSTSAGGYKLQVTGTANITSDLTVDTSTLKVDATNNRVGIGTTSPIAPLHIESTINALADTDEPENCHLLLRNAANDTNEGVGIGFLISAQTDDIGSSIVYKRTGSNAKGELRFNVKTNTTDDGVISQAMVIDDSANVGIGTDSPASLLHLQGSGSTGGLYFANSHDVVRQYFNNDSNDSGFFITYDGTGGAEIELQADGDLILNGSNGDNVGIGTDSPTTTLDVEGTVSYKSIGLSASSDAFDVSGATTVSANSALGNIILGGFANGVSGQIIHVIHRSPTNSLRFEHNEATATQPIFTSTSADKTLSGYGGMTLFCDGSNWFEIGN